MAMIAMEANECRPVPVPGRVRRRRPGLERDGICRGRALDARALSWSRRA